jgi:hypothetical protein
VKSDRQVKAEAAARVQAERRRAAGLCTKDVFHGFNSRAGCALEFGHAGRCE